MTAKFACILGRFVAAFLSTISAPAQAADWTATAHVTVIEGSYLPTQLNFQVDAAAGTCSAGSWLFWNVHGANDTQKQINIQGVYSLLMTAHATGKQIWISGNNSGCTVDFIWIL